MDGREEETRNANPTPQTRSEISNERREPARGPAETGEKLTAKIANLPEPTHSEEISKASLSSKSTKDQKSKYDEIAEKTWDYLSDAIVALVNDDTIQVWTEKSANELLKEYVNMRQYQSSSVYEMEQWLKGYNIQGIPMDFAHDIQALASTALANLYKASGKSGVSSGTMAIWISWILEYATKSYIDDKFGPAFKKLQAFYGKHPKAPGTNVIPQSVYDLVRHESPSSFWKKYFNDRPIMNNAYVQWLIQNGRYEDIEQRWENSKEMQKFHPQIYDLIKAYVAMEKLRKENEKIAKKKQQQQEGKEPYTRGGGAGRR